MAAWVLSAPSAASRAWNRSSRSALTVPPSCATLVIGDAPELPVSPPLADSPVLTVSGASLLSPSRAVCTTDSWLTSCSA